MAPVMRLLLALCLPLSVQAGSFNAQTFFSREGEVFGSEGIYPALTQNLEQLKAAFDEFDQEGDKFMRGEGAGCMQGELKESFSKTTEALEALTKMLPDSDKAVSKLSSAAREAEKAGKSMESSLSRCGSAYSALANEIQEKDMAHALIPYEEFENGNYQISHTIHRPQVKAWEQRGEFIESFRVFLERAEAAREKLGEEFEKYAGKDGANNKEDEKEMAKAMADALKNQPEDVKKRFQERMERFNKLLGDGDTNKADLKKARTEIAHMFGDMRKAALKAGPQAVRKVDALEAKFNNAYSGGAKRGTREFYHGKTPPQTVKTDQNKKDDKRTTEEKKRDKKKKDEVRPGDERMAILSAVGSEMCKTMGVIGVPDSSIKECQRKNLRRLFRSDEDRSLEKQRELANRYLDTLTKGDRYKFDQAIKWANEDRDPIGRQDKLRAAMTEIERHQFANSKSKRLEDKQRMLADLKGIVAKDLTGEEKEKIKPHEDKLKKLLARMMDPKISDADKKALQAEYAREYAAYQEVFRGSAAYQKADEKYGLGRLEEEFITLHRKVEEDKKNIAAIRKKKAAGQALEWEEERLLAMTDFEAERERYKRIELTAFAQGLQEHGRRMDAEELDLKGVPPGAPITIRGLGKPLIGIGPYEDQQGRYIEEERFVNGEVAFARKALPVANKDGSQTFLAVEQRFDEQNNLVETATYVGKSLEDHGGGSTRVVKRGTFDDKGVLLSGVIEEGDLKNGGKTVYVDFEPGVDGQPSHQFFRREKDGEIFKEIIKEKDAAGHSVTTTIDKQAGAWVKVNEATGQVEMAKLDQLYVKRVGHMEGTKFVEDRKRYETGAGEYGGVSEVEGKKYVVDFEYLKDPDAKDPAVRAARLKEVAAALTGKWYGTEAEGVDKENFRDWSEPVENLLKHVRDDPEFGKVNLYVDKEKNRIVVRAEHKNGGGATEFYADREPLSEPWLRVPFDDKIKEQLFQDSEAEFEKWWEKAGGQDEICRNNPHPDDADQGPYLQKGSCRINWFYKIKLPAWKKANGHNYGLGMSRRDLSYEMKDGKPVIDPNTGLPMLDQKIDKKDGKSLERYYRDRRFVGLEGQEFMRDKHNKSGFLVSIDVTQETRISRQVRNSEGRLAEIDNVFGGKQVIYSAPGLTAEMGNVVNRIGQNTVNVIAAGGNIALTVVAANVANFTGTDSFAGDFVKDQAERAKSNIWGIKPLWHDPEEMEKRKAMGLLDTKKEVHGVRQELTEAGHEFLGAVLSGGVQAADQIVMLVGMGKAIDSVGKMGSVGKVFSAVTGGYFSYDMGYQVGHTLSELGEAAGDYYFGSANLSPDERERREKRFLDAVEGTSSHVMTPFFIAHMIHSASSSRKPGVPESETLKAKAESKNVWTREISEMPGFKEFDAAFTKGMETIGLREFFHLEPSVKIEVDAKRLRVENRLGAIEGKKGGASSQEIAEVESLMKEWEGFIAERDLMRNPEVKQEFEAAKERASQLKEKLTQEKAATEKEIQGTEQERKVSDSEIKQNRMQKGLEKFDEEMKTLELKIQEFAKRVEGRGEGGRLTDAEMVELRNLQQKAGETMGDYELRSNLEKDIRGVQERYQEAVELIEKLQQGTLEPSKIQDLAEAARVHEQVKRMSSEAQKEAMQITQALEDYHNLMKGKNANDPYVRKISEVVEQIRESIKQGKEPQFIEMAEGEFAMMKDGQIFFNSKLKGGDVWSKTWAQAHEGQHLVQDKNGGAFRHQNAKEKMAREEDANLLQAENVKLMNEMAYRRMQINQIKDPQIREQILKEVRADPKSVMELDLNKFELTALGERYKDFRNLPKEQIKTLINADYAIQSGGYEYINFVESRLAAKGQALEAYDSYKPAQKAKLFEEFLKESEARPSGGDAETKIRPKRELQPAFSKDGSGKITDAKAEYLEALKAELESTIKTRDSIKDNPGEQAYWEKDAQRIKKKIAELENSGPPSQQPKPAGEASGGRVDVEVVEKIGSVKQRAQQAKVRVNGVEEVRWLKTESQSTVEFDAHSKAYELLKGQEGIKVSKMDQARVNGKKMLMEENIPGNEMGGFASDVTPNRPLNMKEMKRIEQAIEILHKNGVAHGDLHTGNLKVEWNQAKGEYDIWIFDFGGAEMAGRSSPGPGFQVRQAKDARNLRRLKYDLWRDGKLEMDATAREFTAQRNQAEIEIMRTNDKIGNLKKSIEKDPMLEAERIAKESEIKNLEKKVLELEEKWALHDVTKDPGTSN